MPSIENFRKQAKRVLKWHRERHFPVAALIRTHLPAFGGMSDEEILEQPLRLSHAHEIVARQGGFSSWQALLKGADPMSETQSKLDTALDFKRAEPQLLVTDLARSLAFFNDAMGFETQFSYGEPPFYAQVARGAAHLNLRRVSEPLIDSSILSREDYLSATVCVHSIKSLFLEYQARNVVFHQSLRTEPWGAKTFIVADPDGNLILFAE